MDNQHRKIQGYRELTENDIGAINWMKQQGNLLLEVADARKNLEDLPGSAKRDAALAYTHIQDGIMRLVRSVAQPEGHC